MLGHAIESVDDAAHDPVDIYHGNDAGVRCLVRIPLVDRYTEETVPPVPEPGDLEKARGPGPFPFDLFAAMRFWLTDEGNVNAPLEAFDTHDRLTAASSAQARRGITEVPIVNAYLLLARGWIELRVGIQAVSPLPAGKKAVVILSHDVDRPLNPTDLGPALRLIASAVINGRARRAPVALARTVTKAAAVRIREPDARTWLFDEIMELEGGHGFRSSFFFAATPALRRPGHRLDVGYDIRSPKLRAACRKLKAEGAEVGLHIGYSAAEIPGEIERERARLEEALGSPVAGSRHHYWHTGRAFWRTLDRHADAGFRYDSSLAFNEMPGFRLGVALPFRPWNPERNGVIPVVQIVPMVMDGAFFEHGRHTVDDAVAKVEELVGTLKRFEGVASINWHQEACIPASRYYRRWGQAYKAVLDVLAADPEVSIQTCLEVTDAFEARERDLRPTLAGAVSLGR